MWLFCIWHSNLIFYYLTGAPAGGVCGEARSGETSKWSSLNSCTGLLSGNSLSSGGVCSGDSAGSICCFFMSCGSFRNLTKDRQETVTMNLKVFLWGEYWNWTTNRKRQRPEQEFLSSFFSNDVQLVVVPQSTGHFLICHIVSVL